MRWRFIHVFFVTGVVFATVGLLSAHDFWLVPDAFAVGEHSEIVVRGQTSSAFPTSESAVAPERLTEARVLGAAGEETIAVRATEGRSLLLRHRPTTAGQKIVVASLGWRHVQESAESFRRYLVLEGAEDALKRYEQQGQLPTDAVVRRYAKYAKTSVSFGEGPPRLQSRRRSTTRIHSANKSRCAPRRFGVSSAAPPPWEAASACTHPYWGRDNHE